MTSPLHYPELVSSLLKTLDSGILPLIEIEETRIIARAMALSEAFIEDKKTLHVRAVNDPVNAGKSLFSPLILSVRHINGSLQIAWKEIHFIQGLAEQPRWKKHVHLRKGGAGNYYIASLQKSAGYAAELVEDYESRARELRKFWQQLMLLKKDIYAAIRRLPVLTDTDVPIQGHASGQQARTEPDTLPGLIAKPVPEPVLSPDRPRQRRFPASSSHGARMLHRKPRFGGKRLVSASEIASLFHCEQKIVLERQHGERHTPEQVQAQRHGIRVHDAIDRQARAVHNAPRPRTGCFIASHVYGADDPRTWELRRFRDRALMPSALGRWLVRQYYRHSPAWVNWLNHHPRLTIPVRCGLDALRWLQELTDGHRCHDGRDRTGADAAGSIGTPFCPAGLRVHRAPAHAARDCQRDAGAVRTEVVRAPYGAGGKGRSGLSHPEWPAGAGREQDPQA